MAQKHLTKGDPEPPLTGDTLRIYTSKFCPYAHKIRLVLRNKNIEHEEIFVSENEKPEWLLSKTPNGTCPVMVMNAQVMWEPSLCSDYLDDKYTALSPLYPDDPYSKFKHKILMLQFDKFIGNFDDVLHGSSDALKKLHEGLDIIERALKGTLKYFGGMIPAMVDFHMWPFFDRMPALKMLNEDMDAMPPGKYPHLEAWCSAMKELPEVQETSHSLEKYAQLFKGFLARSPSSDL